MNTMEDLTTYQWQTLYENMLQTNQSYVSLLENIEENKFIMVLLTPFMRRVHIQFREAGEIVFVVHKVDKGDKVIVSLALFSGCFALLMSMRPVQASCQFVPRQPATQTMPATVPHANPKRFPVRQGFVVAVPDSPWC